MILSLLVISPFLIVDNKARVLDLSTILLRILLEVDIPTKVFFRHLFNFSTPPRKGIGCHYFGVGRKCPKIFNKVFNRCHIVCFTYLKGIDTKCQVPHPSPH